MLRYLQEFAIRMDELMKKEIVSAAMLTLPVIQPRVGDVCIHFTQYGVLASMGDRFSSKLITSWDQAPLLYDILTDDVIGPLEFAEESKGATYHFVKHKASLEIEACSEATARLITDHYAEIVNDVNLTWP